MGWCGVARVCVGGSFRRARQSRSCSFNMVGRGWVAVPSAAERGDDERFRAWDLLICYRLCCRCAGIQHGREREGERVTGWDQRKGIRDKKKCRLYKHTHTHTHTHTNKGTHTHTLTPERVHTLFTHTHK